MTGWKHIDTAPQDGTHILLLTGDFGIVEGWWDSEVENFYKSDPGCTVYDPADHMGDWVSDWQISAGAPGNDPGDFRLVCGCIPVAWRPKPKMPKTDPFGSFIVPPTS